MFLAAWIGKTIDRLNLRMGPGLEHDVLTVLPEGAHVAILDDPRATGQEWVRIRHRGREGYVATAYVRWPRIARTRVTAVVRDRPQESGATVATLKAGTVLQTLDEAGGWYEVIALGLPGYLPGASLHFPQVGYTTAPLHLRTHPQGDSLSLEVLPTATQVHIWQQHRTWYRVASTRRSGYVHGEFVELAEGPEEEAEQEDVCANPAPPRAEHIQLPPDASRLERQITALWNRLGGLLTRLATELRIAPGVAVAVLTVESGGRAFAESGRMIIRFENQIFYDHWGHEHPETYAQHFTFNAGQRWTGHLWRPATDQSWRPVHTGQDGEWATFSFARTLDDTAAKLSISMGAPQIMGFNYAKLGYDSVHEMFRDFTQSECRQVIGFFNFLAGRGEGTSALITALRARDFVAFARLYNGPGQATTYGALIDTAYQTFRQVWGDGRP